MASGQFHISPGTGNPAVYIAKIKCPVGGDLQHYKNPEMARVAYENDNSTKTFSSLSKNILYTHGEKYKELNNQIKDIFKKVKTNAYDSRPENLAEVRDAVTMLVASQSIGNLGDSKNLTEDVA